MLRINLNYITMLNFQRYKFFTTIIILFSTILFTGLSFKKSSSGIENYVRMNGENNTGGKEIPTNEAYELITNYRSIHNPESDKSIYKTTGWHINKKAIENILSNKNLNSLAFDLVEQNGTLKLIIQGSENNLSDIETGAGTSIFMVQSFCPSDCSSLNK